MRAHLPGVLQVGTAAAPGQARRPAPRGTGRATAARPRSSWPSSPRSSSAWRSRAAGGPDRGHAHEINADHQAATTGSPDAARPAPDRARLQRDRAGRSWPRCCCMIWLTIQFALWYQGRQVALAAAQLGVRVASQDADARAGWQARPSAAPRTTTRGLGTKVLGGQIGASRAGRRGPGPGHGDRSPRCPSCRA